MKRKLLGIEENYDIHYIIERSEKVFLFSPMATTSYSIVSNHLFSKEFDKDKVIFQQTLSGVKTHRKSSNMNKNQIDKFFTKEYSYENIPEHVRISSKIYAIVLEGIYKVMYREQLSPYELTQAYKQIADKCDLMAEDLEEEYGIEIKLLANDMYRKEHGIEVNLKDLMAYKSVKNQLKRD